MCQLTRVYVVTSYELVVLHACTSMNTYMFELIVIVFHACICKNIWSYLYMYVWTNGITYIFMYELFDMFMYKLIALHECMKDSKGLLCLYDLTHSFT